MEARRQELTELLEEHYRARGWTFARAHDGTVRAAGLGGVTFIGLAVLPEDVADERFAARLLALGNERMPKGGELCPLELLPAAECADALRAILDRLSLRARGNVELYSLAAA